MFKILITGYFATTMLKPSIYEKTAYDKGRPNYQLEYCTAGNGSYMINGKEYTRQYGSILFVKPNETFSHWYKVEPYECYTIHFICDDDAFVKKYLDNLPTQIFLENTMEFEKEFKDIIFAREDLIHSFYPKEIFEIKDELFNSKLKPLIIKLYLETFFSPPPTVSAYKKNIEDVKKYILKNFKEDISAKEMAQAAHLSEGFTYRQFKKITGQTPHEYLTDVRLKYACEHLILTHESISEISLKVGFKNPNYLNIIFKKAKGITPLQYRKQNNLKKGTE